ncbi:MAG: high frequency lysogenization protein HflD [Methylomonas sp.]|jgi:high frequency lysogenization protein
MSLKNLTNQTIALAGISQACGLVHLLATTGSADSAFLESSLGSILKVDADSVPDVFGGLAGVKYGLQQLEIQLGGNVFKSPEQARYAAQLVFLHKQLEKRNDLLNTIAIGIAKAQAQTEQYGITHVNVIASLADLYHSTISTMQPRIMVMGDQNFLSTQNTVNKIRALLLAGVRSVLLWRQCGGSRWKLLFLRKKIQDEARFLLTQI